KRRVIAPQSACFRGRRVNVEAGQELRRIPGGACGGCSGHLTNCQLEIEFAHSNSIARIQEDFAPNSLVIDKRTVGAAQVADMDREIVNGKNAVMPTDEFTVWTEVAILFATDEELFGGQGNDAAVVPAPHDFQFRLQHRLVTPPDKITCSTPGFINES